MKNVLSISKQEPSAASKRLLDALARDHGTVPNMYAVMGHSATALEGYLDFTAGMERGVFNQKELEAIKLTVSEENGCEYCIAMHSDLAEKVGFSAEEVTNIRLGMIRDERLNALVLLTKEIVSTKGKPSEGFVEAFYAKGYSEKALVELVMVVGAKVISNYLNHLADTDVDWPRVKELNLKSTV